MLFRCSMPDCYFIQSSLNFKEETLLGSEGDRPVGLSGCQHVRTILGDLNKISPRSSLGEQGATCQRNPSSTTQKWSKFSAAGLPLQDPRSKSALPWPQLCACQGFSSSTGSAPCVPRWRTSRSPSSGWSQAGTRGEGAIGWDLEQAAFCLFSSSLQRQRDAHKVEATSKQHMSVERTRKKGCADSS